LIYIVIRMYGIKAILLVAPRNYPQVSLQNGTQLDIFLQETVSVSMAEPSLRILGTPCTP
jgi:hypothetical protein